MLYPLIIISIFCPLVKGGCEEKLSKCMSKDLRREVCGSDGITYKSKCELIRENCRGREVEIIENGPCQDVVRPCWSAKVGSVGLGFVPKCLSFGGYAPVQCHQGTGYCWCVTPQGKPIANTSVRNARPKCNRKGRRRNDSKLRRRGCGKIERKNFINNLIRIFNTEYERTLQQEEIDKMSQDDLDLASVSWRFSSLDSDNNENLTKEEFQDLKKLIIKVVRPKRCSRSFVRICDIDKDNSITKNEWNQCLKRYQIKRKKKKDDISGVLQKNVPLLSSQLPEITNEERRDEPEVNDCWTDRNSVLEEQAEGMTSLYVPECTSDGRYNKIQCYTSTGYCWCVDEDTGKPIPGTSTRDPDPKCEAVSPPPRPIKGCPEAKRIDFTDELVKFMRAAKQNLTIATEEEGERGVDEEGEREKILSWQFHRLDTNKNKVLEREEWKGFRAMISSEKKLRKCGRKLPKNCDVNHDRKISVTEWYNCLSRRGKSRAPAQGQTTKRKGPNPLESILLDD